jgi:hypothetical protein
MFNIKFDVDDFFLTINSEKETLTSKETVSEFGKERDKIIKQGKLQA